MAKKANGKAKKKANNGTEISLDILSPEKFQTLEEIWDFVAGDGARALRYAIDRALCPAIDLNDVIDLEGQLSDQLKDARQAAVFVGNDLAALAKGAIESEGDPKVCNDGGWVLDKEKRALLFIALMDGHAVPEIKQGIIEYLVDARARAKAGQCRAHEVLKERMELLVRIESLEAERAELGVEWDEILRQDSAICEEINAADNGLGANV